MKEFKLNDILYDNQVKGRPVYDEMGRMYNLTGICQIKRIRCNSEDTNLLLHFAVDDKRQSINVITSKICRKDALDSTRFSKYNINEQLSKAMKEMIDRYEQIPNIKCNMIKSEVLEYCNKIEKNINTLIIIKRYIDNE